MGLACLDSNGTDRCARVREVEPNESEHVDRPVHVSYDEDTAREPYSYSRDERRNSFRDKVKVPRIDTFDMWSFRNEVWLRHCRAHEVVFEVHVTQPPSRSSFKVRSSCLSAERTVRSLNLDRKPPHDQTSMANKPNDMALSVCYQSWRFPSSSVPRS
jgi:hypothetical protein